MKRKFRIIMRYDADFKTKGIGLDQDLPGVDFLWAFLDKVWSWEGGGQVGHGCREICG